MRYPMYIEPTENIQVGDLIDICYQGINITFTVIKPPYQKDNLFYMDLDYSEIEFLSYWDDLEGRWKIIQF